MVKLLNYTPSPEKIIALAASICWSGKNEEELINEWDNLFDKNRCKKLIKKLLSCNHISPFEHASFTFLILCSRSCSHQLVRHRIASFTQQSQRYVKMKKDDYIVPVQNEIIDKTITSIFDTYHKLIEQGIPKEDARCILPNATKTQLILTMNARELIHFFKLRMCNKAQKEIRDIACEMKKLVTSIAPILFSKAGPPCISDGSCPEINPCNMKEN